MNLLLCTVFLIASSDIKPVAPIPRPIVQEVEVKDLTGIYEVQGVQIQGGVRTPYSSLAILKKIPETDKYIVQWTGGIGNNITGIGFLANGKLAFSWKSEGLTGYTEYIIGANGKHKGRWFTNKGIDVWHTETIIFKMPWVVTESDEPPAGKVLFQKPIEEMPIKYLVKADDEDYTVELYKDRVFFRSENWFGFGKLVQGKYRVQWTMDDEVVCYSHYERINDHLYGAYWYASEPEIDYEDIYEKR